MNVLPRCLWYVRLTETWHESGHSRIDVKGQEETSAYRIFLPGCLASSRQLLMKSCARGLMVRFFNKTIPTGDPTRPKHRHRQSARCRLLHRHESCDHCKS